MAASDSQPFHQHVQELRKRITIVVAVLCMGGAVGYGFHTQLIAWLSDPLQQKLYYTSPGGGFQFTLQVCLFASLLITLPVAIYQLIRFVQPAINKHSKKNVLSIWRMLRFIAFSYTLALIGAAFAYYIVLPSAFHFFAGFNSSEIQSLITADNYFSFVIKCVGVFAIIFQLPLILLFINRIHPLSPDKMRKSRKWVIVGSFSIAIFLPFAYDPVTQFLLAAPIVIMYEISIRLVALANRRRTKKESILADLSVVINPNLNEQAALEDDPDLETVEDEPEVLYEEELSDESMPVQEAYDIRSEGAHSTNLHSKVTPSLRPIDAVD